MRTTPAPLVFRSAIAEDAMAVATVRLAAARKLSEQYGKGPWSTESTERAVLAGFRDATIEVALRDDAVVGTFRLSWRKPWAIDRAFFAPATRPLYLTDMAVHPEYQRQGVGRACLHYAELIARAFPADALWLDAYDAEAGAGAFYATCGFHECGRKRYRETPLIYFERAISPLGFRTSS